MTPVLVLNVVGLTRDLLNRFSRRAKNIVTLASDGQSCTLGTVLPAVTCTVQSTFLTGLILLGLKGAGLTLDIGVGATLGTLMFLNVWLIIWPNQKIVVGSNQQVAAGGQADPAAAAAGPKAGLASRTNTLFSVPMLLFMVSSAHLPNGSLLGDSANMLPFLVALAIIAALEANAIFGKQGVMTTVNGVITSSVVLAVVLYGVVTLL